MPTLTLVEDSEDDSENALDLEPPVQADVEVATAPPPESNDEASAGSTQQIRDQIRDAERALFANSAGSAAAMTQISSSGLPLTDGRKRRHSTVLDRRPSTSPEKRIKRSKTTEPYSKHRSSDRIVDNEGSFAALRDDDNALATSRSARYTEHSGGHSSIGLPTGSIQANFVQHEPNVMFRDSGSTNVDNESSQQRMIEQALNSKKGLSTSAAKLVESDEAKSSSFPWTASQQQTQSARKAQEAADQEHLDEVREKLDPAVDHVELPPEEHGVGAVEELDRLPDQEAEVPGPDDSAHQPSPHANMLGSEAALPRQQSSPTVQIPVHHATAISPPKPAPASTQKAGRGRNRKSQNEDSEPLDPEDRAVGLAKERYVPRPSRRRATQVAEEPIDFSVMPEKAAKKKRTKTTSTATAAESHDDRCVETTTTRKSTPKQVNHPISSSTAERATAVKASSCGKPDRTKSSQHKDEPKYTQTVAPPELEAPTPSPLSNQADDEISVKPASIKKDAGDEVFVKPTPRPKASSKVRRSHTTIFEDHVEFAGSQRAPSLTQQQAKRKSDVLSKLDSLPAQPTQKKRRTVVDDEDDEDEDELSLSVPQAAAPDTGADAKIPHNEPEEVPKKPGRGRPAKSTGRVKSAEKVLEDSEAEVDAVEEEEEPSKKKNGRGPSSKAAVNSDVVYGTAKAQTETAKSSTDLMATSYGDEKENAKVPPAKSAPPGMQELTPSPEKPSSTPHKAAAKGSPVSHSPIKSDSKVKYRVGLSKRQRIPPLLRMMKPPKR